MNKYLFSAGVLPSNSLTQNRKIRVTNFLAILYMVLASVFVVLSYFLFPPLIIYPVLAIFVCILVFIMNVWNQLDLARLIVVFIPNTLAAVYHASLISKDEGVLTSFYLFQLSLIVAPWLCIESKEKYMLFGSAFIHLILFFGISVMNPWFEVDVDNSYFREGILVWVLYVFSIVIIFGAFYYLSISRDAEEQRSQSFIEELKLNNEELQKSQEHLRQMLDQLETIQEEEKNRQWINEGILLLADILRDHREDIKTMNRHFLTALVKYLGIHQGGIFIAGDAKNQMIILELTAAYAYDRVKYENKCFVIHHENAEGLVGECFKSAKPIYINNLPKDYTCISTGLGDSPPRALYIVPLVAHGQSYGVLELSSLYEFSATQKTLVDKVTQDLAATIALNKSMEKAKIW